MAEKELKSLKFPGLADVYTIPEGGAGLPFNGGYQDASGFIHLTQDGEELPEEAFTPFLVTGGGGSGSGNNAALSVRNTSGFLSATVAHGSACALSFTWSSVEDELPTGDGTLAVTVGGAVKARRNISQGAVTADVGPYLAAGANAVRLTVTDVYGNTRSLSYSVTAVAVSLSSNFDGDAVYSGDIVYTFVPVGDAEKTVHFILDGSEIEPMTTSVSGRQVSYGIPAALLGHGAHTLRVYFTVSVDGGTLTSNMLYYDLLYDGGADTPVISCALDPSAVVARYTTVTVPYAVYTPGQTTSEVRLYVDGVCVSGDEALAVDASRQTYSYRAATAGTVTFSVVSGTVTRTVTVTVAESEYDIEAETDGLVLHLTPQGRSNSEADPSQWTYGDTAAELTGFNFASNGWTTDSQGAAVLRVSGSARVEVPFEVFGTTPAGADSVRTLGRTVEIDFATRGASADTAVISCMSGAQGISITPQTATLAAAGVTVTARYKEDERVRVSFVMESRSANRLVYVYVNGVLSGAAQYAAGAGFAQSPPAGLSIGSNACVTDIYGIRVYDGALTGRQIVENMIADGTNAAEMAAAWERNDILDAAGNIVIGKLPGDLPYLVIEAAALPASKGDKKTVSGRYVDPIDGARSFTFEGCEIDVQGTSSQYYPRKNFKMKFKGGFTTEAGTAETYALREGAIATDTFCFKADMASSEGANNVELARLYNDACPYKSAPQRENAAVRQGIDGLPVVIFQDDGAGNETFIGKYNFNNDKGTEEVFGFADGDESWEIKNNTSSRAVFKSADFTGDGWQEDFEGRYPDGSTDAERLAAFAAWVNSTDGDVEKFVDELSSWASVDSALFYYLFTELFLMVDSRAKNAFPTRYSEDGKWMWLPYDFDTALGINNEGALAFGYELEDVDHLESGADVFNGQESVFWCNIRDGFSSELQALYRELRSSGAFSYETVEAMFEAHQRKWPETVFNEDAYFKYILPLVENGEDYLAMCQGSKAEQRRWWLHNRFRYMDAKYHTGDAVTDIITFRGYANGDLALTPAVHTWAAARYGANGTLLHTRGLAGSTYTLECPVEHVNDLEIAIYSASRLADVGDLSPMKVGSANFANGTRLRRIKVGDGADGYENGNLTALTVGANTLLETLDARGCVNLTGTVDLTGCTSIREIYLDGTAVQACPVPNGGELAALRLPGTVTELVLRNQPHIETFHLAGAENLTTLYLENVSGAVDAAGILAQMPAGAAVGLTDIHWTYETAAEAQTLLERLGVMKAAEAAGDEIYKPGTAANITGVLRVTEAMTQGKYEALQALAESYPGLSVEAENVIPSVVMYLNGTMTECHTEAESIGAYAFYNRTALESVEIAAAADIAENAFAGCSALGCVTLPESVPGTLAAGAFTGTPVADGFAGVYVPEALLESYGSMANWSDIADIIYPMELAGAPCREIADTWEEIIAATEDGTYAGKYRLGDTKTLEVNGTRAVMQLVAKDADVLYSDSGTTAATTWMVRDPVFQCAYGSAASSGANKTWTDSTLRAYLRGTVLGSMPEAVRAAVKSVRKTYYVGNNRNGFNTSTTSDTVWAPSQREMGRTSVCEDSGVVYARAFRDNASRMKTYDGEAQTYYLRGNRKGWGGSSSSGHNGDYYLALVYEGGNFAESVSSGTPWWKTSNGGSELPAVFGFCI